MKEAEFAKWGLDKGLLESWTLAELDSLSYAQFLVDFLPHSYLKTERQLNEFILSANPQIWDKQDILYSFLFPRNLPHKSWQPQVMKSVLTNEAFNSLQKYVEKVKTKKPMLTWCDIFMRYSMYDTQYLKDLHQQLTHSVQAVLGRKLTPTYSYLSMYTENGICPPHRDKSTCQWTLDLCVNQDKPWILNVEDSSFLMKENEGLFYSGTDQLHWREKIHPGGNCDLVFFHFVEA